MKKRKWEILFCVYLLFLFLVLILKFTGSFQVLLDRMQAEPYGETYNLKPFSTINSQLRHLSESWAQFNLIGNTIPFIPFGFLMPMSYRKKCSLGKVLLTGLLFVLFAELAQFYTNLGAFDVDDIILNMVAIFLGYLPVGIAGVVRKYKRKKKS